MKNSGKSTYTELVKKMEKTAFLRFEEIDGGNGRFIALFADGTQMEFDNKTVYEFSQEFKPLFEIRTSSSNHSTWESYSYRDDEF